jgi:hypothetical protein
MGKKNFVKRRAGCFQKVDHVGYRRLPHRIILVSTKDSQELSDGAAHTYLIALLPLFFFLGTDHRLKLRQDL